MVHGHANNNELQSQYAKFLRGRDDEIAKLQKEIETLRAENARLKETGSALTGITPAKQHDTLKPAPQEPN
jgi:uncharacterized small protein (DUF1192 family)